MWFMEPMNRRRPRCRRVRMNYRVDNGWRVSFQEDGDTNPLPRRLVFLDPGKILEMHIRWGEHKTTAEVHRLERDLRLRNPGGIWLLLTEEQYRKLIY